MNARLDFKNEDEKKKFVLACDADFEKRLDDVLSKLCAEKELKYLTLSGPTCSGKTTASKKLISEFEERGKKVKIISLDDFFRDRTELFKEAEATGGKLDFDSEKALDIPALADFMEKVQAGETAYLPHFDFVSASRTGWEEFSPTDADILVFEGIQAIYPAFTSLFKKDAKRKSIYISPLSGLKVGEFEIKPRDVRLLRRLVRDYKFRAAAPEFTFLLWETVTENEDISILPFAETSDYMIDSLVGYELSMLKTDLETILPQVPADSVYKKYSEAILHGLSYIPAISKDYLPAISLYHEFV